MLGKGSGAKNIGGGPPKFGGFQGGWGKCRRSATPRGVPWGSDVCLASAVVSYFPPSTIRWRGRGASGAKNIMKFGRGRQNMADSRAGWLNAGAPSRSVAFRGAPWRSAVFCAASFLFSNYVFPHPPQLGAGKGGILVRAIIFEIRAESPKIWRAPLMCIESQVRCRSA